MTDSFVDAPPGPFIWLQAWYAAMCDGDWEHGLGVRIESLDNPGWHLRIELSGTGLEGQTHERTRVEREEHDWVDWKIADNAFDAFCGPLNLGDAVHAFRMLVQEGAV